MKTAIKHFIVILCVVTVVTNSWALAPDSMFKGKRPASEQKHRKISRARFIKISAALLAGLGIPIGIWSKIVEKRESNERLRDAATWIKDSYLQIYTIADNLKADQQTANVLFISLYKKQIEGIIRILREEPEFTGLVSRPVDGSLLSPLYRIALPAYFERKGLHFTSEENVCHGNHGSYSLMNARLVTVESNPRKIIIDLGFEKVEGVEVDLGKTILPDYLEWKTGRNPVPAYIVNKTIYFDGSAIRKLAESMWGRRDDLREAYESVVKKDPSDAINLKTIKGKSACRSSSLTKEMMMKAFLYKAYKVYFKDGDKEGFISEYTNRLRNYSKVHELMHIFDEDLFQDAAKNNYDLFQQIFEARAGLASLIACEDKALPVSALLGWDSVQMVSVAHSVAGTSMFRMVEIIFGIDLSRLSTIRVKSKYPGLYDFLINLKRPAEDMEESIARQYRFVQVMNMSDRQLEELGRFIFELMNTDLQRVQPKALLPFIRPMEKVIKPDKPISIPSTEMTTGLFLGPLFYKYSETLLPLRRSIDMPGQFETAM